MDNKLDLLSEIRESHLDFYVYILSRPDGSPFYVGMGRDLRVFVHERQARWKTNKNHRLATIRAIWNAGGEVGTRIESWHATADDAKRREKELMLAIGRRDLGTGPLTNQTAGGDGCPNLGPESVEKMRTNARTAAARPGHRERISASLKEWNRQHPDLVAANRAKSNAANRTAESRRKKSEAVARFYRENPLLAFAYAARKAETNRSPASRAKNREIALLLHSRNDSLTESTRIFKAKRLVVIGRCMSLMEQLGIVVPERRTRFRKGRPGWDRVRDELAAFGLSLPSGKASLATWEAFESQLLVRRIAA